MNESFRDFAWYWQSDAQAETWINLDMLSGKDMVCDVLR